MTIHHSPAPARSDVATPAPAGSSPRHPYAVHGRVLTAGTLAWAATMAVVGIDPVGHADEVARARRIIDAHADAVARGRGVVVVDGRLVESLHVEEARRVAALAAAIAARAGETTA